MLRAAPASVLAAAAIAFAAAACGEGEPAAERADAPATDATFTAPAPAASPPAQPSKEEVAPPGAQARTAMPVGEAVGQHLLSGYRGARPTTSILRAVRRGRLGGVILFADNLPTHAAARRAVAAIKRAAAAGDRPPPLILVDQEGGPVKRFQDLPPMTSAAGMGAAAAPAARARKEGLRTGQALRALGVNVDLAPVADVPRDSTSFLGERAFSRSPGVVARAACGFVAGLTEAGVASSLKHFPGLGHAGGNTDLARIRIDAGRASVDAGLAAYRRCARRAPLVMMSSASYPALGIDRPAVLERRTYRMLETMGFRGLTISDAFDTPAIEGQERPALAAVRAGVDLLLYGQREGGAQLAYDRLVEDAEAGRLSKQELRATAARVIAFKRKWAARG